MNATNAERRRRSGRAVRGLARLGGRAALAGVFVTSGYETLANPAERLELVANAGIPAPQLAVRLNGALMLVAGVAVVAGFRPRPAAAILAGTMVPATIVPHAFWKLQDPEARKTARREFYKNLAIFGGAMLAALTPEAE